MASMHTIREWINAGCKPDYVRAPTIDQLRQLELDDLIVRVETLGAKHPRWLLTSTGWYEADRAQHRGLA